VALQAQQIYIADFEQVRVRPAVDHVAGFAAVHLHGRMLVDKRPLLVAVALETDGILSRGGPHLLGSHGSVRVVAIAALNEPFVDAMVERHGEFGFLVEMAPVAKHWLGFHQQEVLRRRVVRRVAGNATHVVLRVDRVDLIHVRGAAGVADHAAIVDFLGGSVVEGEDFCDVAAAGNVSRSWTVARLASLMGWAAFGIQRGFPVRRFLPSAVDIGVAGLANFGAHIVRRCAGILCGR